MDVVSKGWAAVIENTMGAYGSHVSRDVLLSRSFLVELESGNRV